MTTELAAEVPPEPVDKSVVLDRWSRAWQRDDGGWLCAGHVPSLFGNTATSWPALLIQCGPARLIFDAKEQER
jgi:hypothetical protein